MSDLEQRLREQLLAFNLPQVNLPLNLVGRIEQLTAGPSAVEAAITLHFPVRLLAKAMEAALLELLRSASGIEKCKLTLKCEVQATPAVGETQNLERVKNVIAVASGKGGVGKSTTSVNLALALAAEGAKVGILDADIYGPSQQVMLGVKEGQRPEQYGTHYLKPIVAHGLQSMSMGYLVTEKTPMVWRGPMASGALQQLLYQTYWDDLDYLVIDMPPGTGDIQLTLSQKVPVTGAVIVTTPQDIALLDAKKGIEMFQKVDVPVLGIVENMAVHVCSNCGHAEHLFGEGGGQKIANDYKVPMLGALPLTLNIREQADKGLPVVAENSESETSLIYREVAIRLAAELARRQASGANKAFPNIVIKND
ncbi:iron-sulfur cluster carrier protein ApbC [Litorivivens sp.]|uniref:iron-sulfur cluster carrier protein ApbC n=3 Tax=Litorivivens sp. TaxID=2020868 RepID=UPI003566C1A0